MTSLFSKDEAWGRDPYWYFPHICLSFRWWNSVWILAKLAGQCIFHMLRCVMGVLSPPHLLLPLENKLIASLLGDCGVSVNSFFLCIFLSEGIDLVGRPLYFVSFCIFRDPFRTLPCTNNHFPQLMKVGPYLLLKTNALNTDWTPGFWFQHLSAVPTQHIYLLCLFRAQVGYLWDKTRDNWEKIDESWLLPKDQIIHVNSPVAYWGVY